MGDAVSAADAGVDLPVPEADVIYDDAARRESPLQNTGGGVAGAVRMRAAGHEANGGFGRVRFSAWGD